MCHSNETKRIWENEFSGSYDWKLKKDNIKLSELEKQNINYLLSSIKLTLDEIIKMGLFHCELSEAIQSAPTVTMLKNYIYDYKKQFGTLGKDSNPIIRWVWYSHMLLPTSYQAYLLSPNSIQEKDSSPTEHSAIAEFPVASENNLLSPIESDSDSDSNSPRRKRFVTARIPKRRPITKDLEPSIMLHISTYLSDEDINTLAAVDTFLNNLICQDDLWKTKFFSIDQHQPDRFAIDIRQIESLQDISWRFLYMQKKNMYKLFLHQELTMKKDICTIQ